MEKSITTKVPNRLVLKAETAADLMTANPISVSETATLKEAIAFLADKSFCAPPVVDGAGRPVGVISQTDIVIHDRNKGKNIPATSEYYTNADLTAPTREALSEGFQVERFDTTFVRDIMTPAVLSVGPQDSIIRVVSEMLAFKVHRLFVVDDGVLVGVISELSMYFESYEVRTEHHYVRMCHYYNGQSAWGKSPEKGDLSAHFHQSGI